MRTFILRMLLVVMGSQIGLVLGFSGLAAYRLVWLPKPAGGDARPQIEQQLEGTPFIYDPIISYRFRPHFTGGIDEFKHYVRTTNADGVIGPEGSPDPTKDLLILGDSVAYGYKVPENFTFAFKLQDESRRVWNASCPGWTTYQEVQFYLSRLASRGPWKDVLLCVCLNDLVRFKWVYAEGKFQMEDSRQMLRPLDFSLTPLRARFSGKLKPMAEEDAGFLSAWEESAWQHHFFSHVSELAKKCNLTVAIFPLKNQIKSAREGGDPELVWWPQRRLRKWCEERHVKFIDVANALSPCPSPFIDSCHMTLEGHAAVAELLRSRLRQSDGNSAN